VSEAGRSERSEEAALERGAAERPAARPAERASVPRSRVIALVLAALAASCGSTRLKHERRLDREETQERLKQLEQSGLVLGEFTLAPEPVIDGDTIRVEGLTNSLRLLGLDTEETFKKDKERRAFEKGWESYKKEMRGDGSRPAKYATPVGDEAKDFAKRFFEGASVVRLERDHPGEIRDYFNRYLAYVFVEKDGKLLNYNVECVRAGMSPYFSKYGYSRRFHADFVAAEEEARAAKRGIWDPDGMHYPDYDERKLWWDSRGDFIKKFEDEADRRENWVVLTRWDAVDRLERLVDKEVVLLGAVSDVIYGDRGPTRVKLSRRLHSDFTLVFFDKDVFRSSRIESYKGEFVRVRGYVSRYKNKHMKKYELQIIVELPGQIEGPGRTEDVHAQTP
jgi:endonuclease YncB( thermonuclease family)